MLSNLSRQAAAGFSPRALTTYDAVAARSRAQLAGYVGWLSANNVQGYVGEYGWPQTSSAGTDSQYDERWDTVAEQWLNAVDQAGLNATVWCVSDWAVDLMAYRSLHNDGSVLSIVTSVGAEIEKHQTTSNYWRGINMVGAEFGSAGGNGAIYDGAVGTQYTYPNGADWAFLAGRGVTFIRLAFRWERLQPTLKGPLDSSELGRIKTALDGASAAGLKVLLNCQNFGRYDTAAATNSSYSTAGVYDLGQNAPSAIGGTMVSCFTDFWTRVVSAVSTTSGLFGYGLTNEPHDLTGGVSSWQAASVAAVEAIRLLDTTHYISVAGYSWSSIPFWVSVNGSTPWLTETIPNGQPNAGQARNRDPYLLFEGHHYWDNDHSGTYASSYNTEIANAQQQGYGSYQA